MIVSVENIVTVYTRHADGCPDAEKGPSHKGCGCPKWLYEHRSRRRYSAKTNSWKEAARRGHKREDELAGVETSPAGHSLIEKVDAFIAPMKALGRSKDQIEKYDLWLRRRFVSWCHGKGITYLHQIETKHIEEFRATWSQWNISPISAQKATERISSFFIHCIANRWITSNPRNGLQKISVPPPRVEYFTEEHCLCIYEAISLVAVKQSAIVRRKAQLRLRAMFDLLLATGLRIADAACLPRAALQRDKDGQWWIRTITLKKKKLVCIPIHEDLAAELKATPKAEHTGNAYFFWSGEGEPETQGKDWWERFSILFRHANITNEDGSRKRCHPHMFRDTFAINCLSDGVSLEEVQNMLGHDSIKTTERHYGHWCKSRSDRLVRSMSASLNKRGSFLKAS